VNGAANGSGDTAGPSPFMTKAEYGAFVRLSDRQINRRMSMGLTAAYVREPGSRRVLFVRADAEARAKANTFQNSAQEAAQQRAASLDSSKGELKENDP
jgi:hypothetical protein